MLREVGRKPQSLGTGVADDCEPPCGFSELNLGLLQEQQVLLITELSPQALNSFLLIMFAVEEGDVPHQTLNLSF